MIYGPDSAALSLREYCPRSGACRCSGRSLFSPVSSDLVGILGGLFERTSMAEPCPSAPPRPGLAAPDSSGSDSGLASAAKSNVRIQTSVFLIRGGDSNGICESARIPLLRRRVRALVAPDTSVNRIVAKAPRVKRVVCLAKRRTAPAHDRLAPFTQAKIRPISPAPARWL